ncbi:hypothetical protein MTP99_000972 [Tenebrio molitor]|jgi:hypothetical protein|nr:hypothetical protein MTP99_000972 [Tenebrio molitor]
MIVHERSPIACNIYRLHLRYQHAIVLSSTPYTALMDSCKANGTIRQPQGKPCASSNTTKNGNEERKRGETHYHDVDDEDEGTASGAARHRGYGSNGPNTHITVPWRW